MSKKMLVLKCCGHVDEDKEILSIKSHAELYNFEVIVKTPCTNDELKRSLACSEKYDYIYLSSHGDADGFSHGSNGLSMTWDEFGLSICENECLDENAVLLLSCCRGGLNEVAYKMFYACPQILYICGPRQNVTSVESIMGFEILIYNMIYRGVDPIVACEKIMSGTDIRFKCFDRIETLSETAYLKWEENKESTSDISQWKSEDLAEWIKKAQEELDKR